MGVAVGGPCVGLKKHQGAQVEPPQLCAAVTSHKWYSGPTCKNCYERNKTAGRKRPKMARTEDAPAESGGDIPLVCLRVSAAGQRERDCNNRAVRKCGREYRSREGENRGPLT